MQLRRTWPSAPSSLHLPQTRLARPQPANARQDTAGSKASDQPPRQSALPRSIKRPAHDRFVVSQLRRPQARPRSGVAAPPTTGRPARPPAPRTHAPPRRRHRTRHLSPQHASPQARRPPPARRPPARRPPPAHRPPTRRPPPAHRPPTRRPPPAHRPPTRRPLPTRRPPARRPPARRPPPERGPPTRRHRRRRAAPATLLMARLRLAAPCTRPTQPNRHNAQGWRRVGLVGLARTAAPVGRLCHGLVFRLQVVAALRLVSGASASGCRGQRGDSADLARWRVQ